MKKILLLCSLVVPFLLGGCSKSNIDGPKNNYYQNYRFRRTASEEDRRITENGGDLYKRFKVSSINSTEETYSYSDGIENFESIKINRQFYNHPSSTSAYPYVMEANKEYYHRTKGNYRQTIDEYTSNTKQWEGSYNAVFTVEVVKRDDTETINRNAQYIEGKELFNSYYTNPVGEAYIDLNDNICYYIDHTEVTTDTDINEQDYKYTHKEQSIYVFNKQSLALVKYHYYDEVVTNRDPTTGEYYKNERRISYKYQEIDYEYKERSNVNISKFEALMDGYSTIVKFDVIEHDYYFKKNEDWYELDLFNGWSSIHKDPELKIDQEGKYIYTLEVSIYSGYNYPTANAYAYGFEAEMDVLQGANVKAGFGFKIHYDGYYELLEQYNIKVVESPKGQVLIHTATGNSPHLYITFVVDPNDGYRTDVTLDVGYPTSYEYDG